MTDRLLGLLIEFDEMGFSPTTVCEEPEGYAIKWKELLLEEIQALESDNVSLRNEADENAALSMESKMRADRLEAENAALRGRLEKAVDKEQIAKLLAGMFGCPCDYFPLDEEMYEYCDDCGMDNVVCWEKVIDKKSARLTELKGGQE